MAMNDHEMATKLKKRFDEIDAEMGREDNEAKHIVGDRMLCELLTELGYTETVGVFNSFTKWYA